MDSSSRDEGKNGNFQEEKKKETKSFWRINRDTLPFKIHFFLFCGALSGVIPYKTVFSRYQLGLRATDIAAIFTSQQFVLVVSKTIIGLLVDHLNKLKFAIISISLLQAVFYMALLGVPKIDINKNHVSNNTLERNVCLTKWRKDSLHSEPNCCLNTDADDYEYCAVDLKCLISVFPSTADMLTAASCHDSNCSVVCSTKGTIPNTDKENFTDLVLLGPESSVWKELVKEFVHQEKMEHPSYFEFNSFDVDLIRDSPSSYYYKYYSEYDGKNHSLATSECDSLLFLTSNKDSCEAFSSFLRNGSDKPLHLMEVTNNDNPAESKYDEKSGTIVYEVTGAALYSTYQFWVFILLLICAGLCSNAMFTMSDTACHEVLQRTGSDYGKQRAWGAVGWGILAPICGFLNDIATKSAGHPNYAPGFYINAVLAVALALNISRVDLVKPDTSKNFWKDVKRVLQSREFMVFETGVFVVGMLTGTLWCYLMIYLESLGGSRFLFGLVHTCQCFLGEVPLMFFSGNIIRKVGHLNVLSLTFLAFTIRFTCYQFLTNPWYVLPVEMLHGLTFGVFYSCMTSYAKLSALPGAETTTQSILCVTYEGLGAGVGCIITGVLYDNLGGRTTFLICSIGSFIAFICQTMANYSLKARSKTMNLDL